VLPRPPLSPLRMQTHTHTHTHASDKRHDSKDREPSS
jgi:hypothetical protein